MSADRHLVVTSEPEADVGVWDALDQAVAVQTSLRDPMQSYLDGLTSDASRSTAIKRLRAVARLVAVPDYATLPWGQLRAHHVAFIRSKLVKAEATPATVNLTLAVLRGIARQARDFNLMTDEEYRRITEVKPHKGSRLPPGRHVRAGE
jgi:integrase/recombinase XerD